jgi:predicted nucleotide-binding protein
MALPIRTTVQDIEKICIYLLTKPTGATLVEAKAVLDSKVLDARKINALKFWDLIEENNGKMRLTEAGRQLAKDKGARLAQVIRDVVARVRPYAAVVERSVHRNELTITATEVAAHWHQHFKAEASDSDKILNDQAVCFFQLAEAADLGHLTIGRHGQPTRFDFDEHTAGSFVRDGGIESVRDNVPLEDEEEGDDDVLAAARPARDLTPSAEPLALEKIRPKGNRVFLTHGKNKRILQEVKEIVAYGKFEPVVAQEHETAAKPVPEKVMDDMRSCQAAVIHVGSEGVLYDKDNNEYPQINGNVLIEIGAAMALYGRNFILLVEDGVKLPSNLQGLYECRYEGNQLSGEATMKLLKAFNEFK